MGSANKTARLGLNVWDAGDSPMRVDFNADNAAVDAAFVEADEKFDAAEEALREARRIALDAYARSVIEDDREAIAASSGAWLENFVWPCGFDFASGTAQYLLTDGEDDSRNFVGATAGVHPSYGDIDSRTSKDNIALPFYLKAKSKVRGLVARPVWAYDLTIETPVTAAVYKATASGSTYVLGEKVFEATKERSKIVSNGSFVDDPQNYVDTPFELAAGQYVVVFHGSMLRVNHYVGTTDDHNPRLKPFDKMYTLESGSTLTVSADYYCDVGVYWSEVSDPYGWLSAKNVEFAGGMSGAAVYVFSEGSDLGCAAEITIGGVKHTLSADANLRNSLCAKGLYMSKLEGDFGGKASGAAEVRVGFESLSAAKVRKILVIGIR